MGLNIELPAHLSDFLDPHVFPIPDKFCDAIQSMLTSLFQHEVGNESHAISQMLRACRHRRLRVPYTQEDMSGLAAMWLLGSYSTLADFLDDSARLPHTTFKVLTIAGHIRSDRPISIAEHYIAQLEEQVKRQSDSDRDSAHCTLASGIAYLCFAIWRHSTGGGYGDRHIKMARNFAELARSLADSLQARLSSSNHCLLYLVDSPSDIDWENAQALAQELISHSTETGVWRHQFDDTIALFYSALAKANPGHAEEYLKLASRYAARAM